MANAIPITMFPGQQPYFYLCAGFDSGGDFLMQQVFPVTAWGARYLAAPTVAYNDPVRINMQTALRVYYDDA